MAWVPGAHCKVWSWIKALAAYQLFVHLTLSGLPLGPRRIILGHLRKQEGCADHPNEEPHVANQNLDNLQLNESFVRCVDGTAPMRLDFFNGQLPFLPLECLCLLFYCNICPAKGVVFIGGGMYL